MGKGRTMTDEQRRIFLEALEETANVSEAARIVKLSRNCCYANRKSDEAFAELWDEAVETAVDALEREAWRRAQDGWDEAVFHDGAICGHKRKYSDHLMALLLRAHRPDKYAARHEIFGKDGGPIKIDQRKALAEDARNVLRGMIERAGTEGAESGQFDDASESA